MSPKHSYSFEFEQTIIKFIKQYPSLNLRELARELATSAQLIKYHLDNLIKESKIQVKKDGKYHRYYPKDFKIEDEEEKILHCLRKPQLLSVIMIFLDKHENQRPLKNSELLEALDIKLAGTVTYYTNKLIEAEILEKTDGGYSLKNPYLVKMLLKKYKPTQSVIDNFTSLWLNYFN